MSQNSIDLDVPFHIYDSCLANSPTPAGGNGLSNTIKAANPFTGSLITPTAIILHYTVGQYDNDPQDIMQVLRNREGGGRQVQLYVDDEGDVHQLTESLETRPKQTMSDDTWNDISIGIEIESLNSNDVQENIQDILNNPVQYQSVLNVVRELVAKYKIDATADTTTKRGVFGHYEANPGSSDPGQEYMAKIRTDLASTGSTGSQAAPAMFGTGGAENLDIGNAFSLGTDGKERRVNLVKHLMADFNLSPEQASGIVGNLMHESAATSTEAETLPPDRRFGVLGPTTPDYNSNTAYGWAQWTAGRKRAMVDQAVEKGYMPSRESNGTDPANYAHLKREFNESYQATITALREQNNPEDAATSFEKTFERSGEQAISERRAAARKVFDEYKENPSSGVCGSSGMATIVGDYAFPLVVNKSGIPNRSMFANNTASKGGHPYTAYDIYAAPGTEVVAFLSGTVIRVGEDKCPGRSILVYNQESDLTISYLHLAFENHVSEGDSIATGQHIGVVGSAAQGCGTPHLHIDASAGATRPSCKREDCPPQNASKFRDIGSQLYETFEALPE